MGAASPVSPDRRLWTALALALASLSLTPVPAAVSVLLSQASPAGRTGSQFLGYYGVWSVTLALGSAATVSAIAAGDMAIGRLARYPARVAHVAWIGVAVVGIAIAALDGVAIALAIYLVYGMRCPAGCL